MRPNGDRWFDWPSIRLRDSTIDSQKRKVEVLAHAAKWINAKRTEPVTEVAVRSLKSRLELVQQLLPLAATKHRESIEYVHHLRVASRRAEATLEMYRELLPPWRATWIQKQLGRIRRATNDARDDDVLALRLSKDNSSPAAELLKLVCEHRDHAQQAVMDVYERMTRKQGRFDRRVKKLLQRVHIRGKQRKSKEPSFHIWAQGHLRPILDDFFETAQGDLNATDRLHQFRIAGKKLRYALELLSASFDSSLREVAYPLLEALQDKLGRINDHASASNRLERWLSETDDAERGKYLSEMLHSERQQLLESQQRFFAWWSVERQIELRRAFERVVGSDSRTEN